MGNFLRKNRVIQMQHLPIILLIMSLGLTGNFSEKLSVDGVEKNRENLKLNRLSFKLNPSSLMLSNSQPPIAQGTGVKIMLEIHKQITRKNEEGQTETTWLQLPPQASVEPGDLVRYTIRGENNSDRAIANFILTQPIPRQVVYVPDSATSSEEAEITYSIDDGETFVANPAIAVTLEDGSEETQPAPPERYTHVRWIFENPVAAGESVTGQFEVRVK